MDNLSLVAVCAFTAILACGLETAALTSWRRSAGEHWAHRAAALYPARRLASSVIVLLPAAVVLALRMWRPEWAQPPFLTFLAGALGAWLAGGVTAWQWDPRRRLGEALATPLFRALVFFPTWVATAVLFWFLGPDDWWWAAGATGAAGLVLATPAFGLLTSAILRLLGCMRPADERLARIARGAGDQSGMRANHVWAATLAASSAWALPAGKHLIVSERLLADLTDDEVRAVCAHELAHFYEPWFIQLLRVLVPCTVFSFLFAACAEGEDRAQALLGAGVLTLAANFSWALLSRRLEAEADHATTRHETHRHVFGTALEKLYRSNQFPAVVGGASRTHPDLYDRMLAAGVQPEFSRRSAPKGSLWTWGLFALVVGLLAGTFVKR